MGNKLARTTQVSPSEYYLHDLPSSYNLVLKEALGGGRFLKSVLCVHDEGLLLVKVYFKRGESPDLKVFFSSYSYSIVFFVRVTVEFGRAMHFELLMCFDFNISWFAVLVYIFRYLV